MKKILAIIVILMFSFPVSAYDSYYSNSGHSTYVERGYGAYVDERPIPRNKFADEAIAKGNYDGSWEGMRKKRIEEGIQQLIWDNQMNRQKRLD